MKKHTHPGAGKQADAALSRIRALVDEQAENEALWVVYPFGQQPIAEAYLQQELRRLHALIEEVTSDAAR